MSESSFPFDDFYGQDIPQSFRLALAQNCYAAQYFENLPPADQIKIIETSRMASGEQEVNDIVGSIIPH